MVVALGWLGIAALQGVRGVNSANDGLDAMDELRGVATGSLDELVDSVGGETDDVSEEDASAQLATAAGHFADASDALDSWAIQPLRWVPVLGRQVRSASALADSAETVAGEASVAVGELSDVLAGSSAAPATRLAAVQRSSEALASFAESVKNLDLGPEESLVPPLADARNRFAEEYVRVTDTLFSMSSVLLGVEQLLAGPSRYLVLGANNAEMRSGGGMILQVGPLDIDAGEFDIGEFRPTQELVLDSPVSVDPDIEARWGALSPGRDWRNTNLSPRFDQTGATTAAMWEALGEEPVDGVILLDVPAIEALLEVTGPVTLDSGEVVSADTVAQDLLIDQYTAFDDRDVRRERLGRVAAEVFNALNSGEISASELLSVLREMGAGRHMMMWSSDPLQQEAWEELGTAGVPPSDSLLLSVLNRGGNKLDPYLDVEAQVSVDDSVEPARFTVQVHLANNAPQGLPFYVAGPHPGSELSTAEYRGIVSLTMPSGAGNVTIGGAVPVALGDDGPTRVAAGEARVLRGESATVTVSFDLPAGWEGMSGQPSARVPASEWITPWGRFSGELAVELDFGRE